MNLQKEIERQKSSDKILVIIDEASKSTIINYLLLLNSNWQKEIYLRRRFGCFRCFDFSLFTFWFKSCKLSSGINFLYTVNY